MRRRYKDRRKAGAAIRARRTQQPLVIDNVWISFGPSTPMNLAGSRIPKYPWNTQMNLAPGYGYQFVAISLNASCASCDPAEAAVRALGRVAALGRASATREC